MPYLDQPQNHGFPAALLSWEGFSALWIQQYDPLGNWVASTCVAGLPVLVLLGLLASGRAGAWQAALAGLVTAFGAAVVVFHMPATLALASVVYGINFAIFRIVWLIVAAVFLYDIAVATGQFDIMKASIAKLSGDRRLQAVLIAFCFGAFIEGAAGFGAPVAISAAFLVGLGFDPFLAALLCLIANTAPVAWGALGTPIRTLANVTGMDVFALSATSGRILPPLSLILPMWLVRSMVPWRETFAVWPALLVVGGTFAATQFFVSNFMGFELVDIISSVSSLVAGILLLKVWKPRQEWRFPHEREADEALAARGPGAPETSISLSPGKVAKAWMPFVLLSMSVLVWGLPGVKRWMENPHDLGGGQIVRFAWKPELPGLHLGVAKGEAVTGHAVPDPKEDREAALLDVVPLSSTGTAVFLAALASGLLLGVGPGALALTFWRTLRRLVPAIAAILCMLALGNVTRYCGMDAVLGLAFTRTGPLLYPIFGTMLGWLGVALTGSDTASNVLFGNLQKIAAGKLGLNPILMASANTTGGVMGKMIDAQSIVVAAAATGEGGKEGDLLRAVVWHSVSLALLVGAIVWLYAHVLPGVVAVPAQH
jgi:lactate permease